jgi:alkylhydroperoxidase family enzyme
MANVALVNKPKGLVQRYAWRFTRKQFGRIVEPLQAAAHHNGVLMAAGALEMVVDKRWNKLDRSLRWLALQATSAAIGCSWCIDFGYYESVQQGADPRKIRDVTRWRQSDVYDERERLVLEYAEAVNATPSQVDDDLATRLAAKFGNEQLVELAGWVALENYRSRFNVGLGLRSEGFAAQCDVPLDLG